MLFVRNLCRNVLMLTIMKGCCSLRPRQLDRESYFCDWKPLSFGNFPDLSIYSRNVACGVLSFRSVAPLALQSLMMR